jgi:hypothetical protein
MLKMGKDKLDKQINKFVGLSNSKHKQENSRKTKKIKSKLKDEIDNFLEETKTNNKKSDEIILATGSYIIK